MTPDLPEHPVDLTPEQRGYLVGLRGFVAEPPTAAGLVRKALPRMTVFVILFGGAAAWSWAVGELWAAWFAGGVLTGILLLLFANINRAVRLWPATAAVVDWRRLNDLLGDHDPPRDRP